MTTAPLRTRSSAIDAESYVHEQLGLIGMHACMAQTFLEAHDAPGFDYSLKSLTARVRAVVGIVNDLQAFAPKERAGG